MKLMWQTMRGPALAFAVAGCLWVFNVATPRAQGSAGGTLPPLPAGIQSARLPDGTLMLTDAKGIRTSCAPALTYMHSKPALTGEDFAVADFRELNHGWSEVGFNLTPVAKKRMEAAREHHGKLLAYVIDGNYKGGVVYPSPIVIPYDIRITLQDPAEAKRAIEACKKP